MVPSYTKDGAPLLRGVKFDIYRIAVDGSDGRAHARAMIVHPGAVVILPLLTPTSLVLIRNHRHAIEQPLWELPAGTLEAGEAPAAAAAREVREETGYRAGRLERMLDFYSAPGFCTERLWVYAAYDLDRDDQALEATERITVHERTLDESMRMVHTGEIRDAKTIAAILYYRQFVLHDQR